MTGPGRGTLSDVLRAARLALEPFASVGAEIPADIDDEAILAGLEEISVADWRRAAAVIRELDEQVPCEVCGCTTARACPGGCTWDPGFAEAGRAVCSRCTDKASPITPRILTPEDPEYGATLEELGGR